MNSPSKYELQLDSFLVARTTDSNPDGVWQYTSTFSSTRKNRTMTHWTRRADNETLSNSERIFITQKLLVPVCGLLDNKKSRIFKETLPTGDDASEYAWSNYWAKQDWSDHSNENAAAPRVATMHALTYSWITYLWHGCRGKQISEMSSNLRREDCNRLFISTLLTPGSEETPCYLSIYLIFGFLLREGRGHFEWTENEIHY